jgi:hypothetical protein
MKRCETVSAEAQVMQSTRSVALSGATHSTNFYLHGGNQREIYSRISPSTCERAADNLAPSRHIPGRQLIFPIDDIFDVGAPTTTVTDHIHSARRLQTASREQQRPGIPAVHY